MKKLIKSTLSVLTLATSFNVLAADIELGYAGYGGNGCPAGTADVTLSPDKKSLSILFDEYFVEAAPRRFKRKSCNISIPVHVPQGFSVSLLEVDYRGYVGLPRRSSAVFSSEYFFAGQRGPRFSRTFRGKTDVDYKIDNNLVVGAMVWSRCGADVNLRVNTSMRINNRYSREDAIATVDSADFSAGIIYKLTWKRCR